MRRFERCSKPTHRDAGSANRRATRWCARRLMTHTQSGSCLNGELGLRSRSAPLPCLSSDCHRRPAPAANPESARPTRCRARLSAERLVPLKVGSRLAPEAGRGCWQPPGQGSLRRWRREHGLAPRDRAAEPAGAGGLRAQEGDVAGNAPCGADALEKRRSLLVRRASRLRRGWVGSREPNLTGDL
jgi:hypothetical protein